MSFLATRNGPSTSAPGDGSRTITITPTPSGEEGAEGSSSGTVGTLRLEPKKKASPRVAWDEGVVDNEGCGKKKSKSEHGYSI